MIRATLVSAMDFAARKGVEYEAYSYRKNGKWYICSTGPRYCSISEVIDYDDDGLALLLQKEKKEATNLHIVPDKPPGTDPPAA